MPQVQVINREEDPVINQIRSAGQAIGDALRRRQAMQLTVQELKIKQKNSQNLSEQNRLKAMEQMSNLLIKASETVEKTGNKQMGALLFKQAMSNAPQGFEGSDLFAEISKLNEDNINELISLEEGGISEAGLRGSKAALNQAEAGFLQGSNPGTGGNEAGANAVGDDGVITKITRRGVTREFPQARQEMSRAGAVGTASVPKPTAEQKNALIGVKQQRANVSRLFNEAKKVEGTGPIMGNLSAGVGIVTGGKMSPEMRKYIKQLPAFTAGLYRDLTGDKRLSDQDASERAKPLLWDPRKDDISIRDDMFNTILIALQNREDMIRNGTATVDPETGKLVTPLDTVLQSRSPDTGQGNKVGRFTVEVE